MPAPYYTSPFYKRFITCMDLDRAATILSSKLRRSLYLDQYIFKNGSEYIDKPVNYSKFLTSQRQQYHPPQSIALPVGNLMRYGLINLQLGKLRHPYTAFGLLVVKQGDTYSTEIGVIVHSKYVVITYESSFQIGEGTEATFYPALDGSYISAYRVKRLAKNQKESLGVVELDTEENLSQTYGKIMFQSSAGRDNRRQEPRSQRRRGRGRRDREERDNLQGMNRNQTVHYSTLNGQARFTLSTSPANNVPDKGVNLDFNDSNEIVIKSIIRLGERYELLVDDLAVLDTIGIHEPMVLSCDKMDLTTLECIWIAQRKWEETTRINLSFSQIGAELCRHFQNAHWQHLTQLDLSLNLIGPKGMFYLSKIAMPALEDLDLRNCRLENDGCKWLSKAGWQGLRKLNLRTNMIAETGCSWLREGRWPLLKDLNLRKNKIGRGCKYLATARWSLEKIELGKSLIDDRSCREISRACWPGLIHLGLEENIISNKGAKWLSKGNWKELKFLLVRGNDDLTKAGLGHLSRLNSPNLYKISLNYFYDFPHSLFQILRADFPFLCRMNPLLIQDYKRRDRYEREQSGSRKTVIDIVKRRFSECEVAEQNNSQDW